MSATPSETALSSPSFDVLVAGSGIVGDTLALALAARGFRVALQGSRSTRVPQDIAHDDVRAYSINASSQAVLDAVGAWQALPADARTAVHDMRVAGDAGTSAIEFSAWQQQVRELAWIVDAGALEAALDALVASAPGVTRLASDAARPDVSLMAVAEGRASATRDALGVRFERQPYGQHAVAARITSDRPHANVARQWFLAPDILALLPFDRPQADRSHGLVWSVSPERARELMAMPPDAFEQALHDATGGEAGRFALASSRASWPLALGRADRTVGPGWVLLGDAAHQVHPLAGQGLNLGLGDVTALLATLDAREPWRPLGDERLLARYAQARAWPVAAMSGVTDALQLLFAHPSPIVRELRNHGLGLVNRLGPVKRWLAGEALGQ